MSRELQQVPVRTVVKVPITLPGIGHEGYGHPPGDRAQRVVTCQGTHRDTAMNEAKEIKEHAEATTVTAELARKNTSNMMKLIPTVLFLFFYYS